MITKKMRIKSILNYIGSVISWTLFSILIICAAFLLYYFVSNFMKLKVVNIDLFSLYIQ